MIRPDIRHQHKSENESEIRHTHVPQILLYIAETSFHFPLSIISTEKWKEWH